MDGWAYGKPAAINRNSVVLLWHAAIAPSVMSIKKTGAVCNHIPMIFGRWWRTYFIHDLCSYSNNLLCPYGVLLWLAKNEKMQDACSRKRLLWAVLLTFLKRFCEPFTPPQSLDLQGWDFLEVNVPVIPVIFCFLFLLVLSSIVSKYLLT